MEGSLCFVDPGATDQRSVLRCDKLIPGCVVSRDYRKRAGVCLCNGQAHTIEPRRVQTDISERVYVPRVYKRAFNDLHPIVGNAKLQKSRGPRGAPCEI